MYALSAPAWDVKTAGFPWNHPVVPTGELLFCMNQPEPGSALTLSNPWGDAQGGGAATATEAESEPDPLSVVKLAVLSYWPPLAVVVPLTTCTCVLVPALSTVGA